MTTSTINITRKGQVTIPKEVRDKLNATAIYFEVKNDIVIVRPARDAAASLREYARNVKPSVSAKQMKVKAWQAVVREKTGKQSS